MEIRYIGHSSFVIKGKSATLVTDPFDPVMVGLKFPKHLSCDIVTVSHDHQDHNSIDQLDGKPFAVTGPGEFEIKGVGIVGIGVYHDASSGQERGKNNIYRIEIDGISVVHLGDIGHVLTAEMVDALDGVDILMIPVGGFYTVDSVKAKEIITEVEPAIIIPMHYGRPDINQKAFGELSPLTQFLKEMGKDEVVPVPKLTVTKDRIPTEIQIAVLESKD
ncbi:hypothetical protein A2Z33_01320 [Candidatus Gottesmanbacteria bacterium RBG_16_52_11]|uniref:Lactamase n=1 Tax=Candidatus Gottesmanbacteria bacterium RBG_16_52_11 TaxID=1798374 RepID=A0A1F5YNT9_9BACT|nr:MAG: hypothetical protein A2Z33_01320 [Candidatus Gottesmanbacteria bacterium RBG_16_52_11]